MIIEMYEKFGEIIIAEMRTAEENQQIADEARNRIAEEERMRKEKEERENRLIANEVLVKLVNAINATAEKGKTVLSVEWRKDVSMEPFGITWEDYQKGEKYFKPVFESAGYRVDSLYEYSQSWRERSGKRGYTSISWS